MLVLTRKRSEMIQIGDDVVVKVIRTGRNSVKIGVEAPAHVRVLRAELVDDETLARLNVGTLHPRPDYGAMAMACSDQYPHVA